MVNDAETTAAEVFLARLAEHGVDYVFGNAGTDFPSLIEAFAKARETGVKLPIPIAVPHENLAMAMAHGYYQITGRPQAVILHVNVGTANAICGLLNASRDNIPVLLFAGRTPLTEDDHFGSRSVFIHWGQEMFDQAGMVRESVKWDYELRTPGQAADVVDRAISIAMSEPRGPIYVTLPREILAQPAPPPKRSIDAVAAASPPGPDPRAIETLAELIAAADTPILITGAYGKHAEDVPVLAEFADNHAIPVIPYRPRYVNLPTNHPMHVGFEVGPHIGDADLIMVVDSDVPWMPKLHKINADAKVVHIGADPLFSDYVMRSFPSHLAITGSSPLVLAALDRRLTAEKVSEAKKELRRVQAQTFRTEATVTRQTTVETVSAKPLSTMPWVGHCLNEAKKKDDIIVTEVVFPLHMIDFEQPGCHFGMSPAGGLGWGLGESIGLKMATPARRVISVVGDGGYMFGNPTPAHFICEAMELPILTIILNNGMWGAVRRATLSMYPDGAAAKSNDAPLTHLKPSPRFEHIVEASGGYAERVETAADLPAALDRALKVIDSEKRQAVLNVLCEYSDGAAIQDARR